MTNPHAQAMQVVIVAARILSVLDLPARIREADHAQAIGPILAPSLYRSKTGALAQDQDLLEAALPLWRLARQLGAHQVVDQRPAHEEAGP